MYKRIMNIKYHKKIETPTNHKLVRGKLWWEERWYSFCSIHREYDETCNICNLGSWVNTWKHNVSSIIYDMFPGLWRWWINR